MSPTDDSLTGPPADPAPAPQPSGDAGWKRDKQGRQYAAARGRSGVVYRQGNETVDEAMARDAKGPKDRKPRKAAKPSEPGGTQRKPPAPTTVDLKQLEHDLSMALSAPGMVAGTFGEEWLSEHFLKQGPTLARHLVVAADQNPWLRDKLQALVAGPEMFMQLVTLATLSGAVIGYAVPPVLYLFTKPSEGRLGKARDLYGVPERPVKEAPPDAPPAPPAAPAEPAAAAAA